MKYRTIIVTAAAVWMAVVGVAQDKPKANEPSVVTCEIRFVEAPRADVNKLLPNTGYALKEDVLQKLQAWVEEKKATILAQPRVSTISGTTAQTKAVRELIYLTGNEPPAIAPPGSEVGGAGAGARPEVFKTRELGILFNLTPTIGPDGKWINIAVVPEISHLSRRGFIKQETAKRAVSQPDVYSWNLTTSVVLKSGSTVVLAVLDPVGEEKYMRQDNVLIVLLSAAVNPAE